MKKCKLPVRAYIVALRADELKRQERIVRECIERAQRVGDVARRSIDDADARCQIGDHNARLLGNLDYLADYFHILRGILTRQIAEIVREEQEKEGGEE